MQQQHRRTLSGVLNKLLDKGFTHGFKLKKNKLKCLESGKLYSPDELRIIEYHRFEGESNPADMSVVFAVECSDGDKGVIVSAYGTYADKELIAFMDKVKIQERTEVSG